MPRVSKSSERRITNPHALEERQLKEIGARVTSHVSGAIETAIGALETTSVYGVHNSSYLWANVNVTSTAQHSGVLFGTHGLPATGPLGVFLHVEASCASDSSPASVKFSKFGETPDSYSPGLYVMWNGGYGSCTVAVPLSTDGKVTMRNPSGTTAFNTYVIVVGYWT
jgi:hypothetical protein